MSSSSDHLSFLLNKLAEARAAGYLAMLVLPTRSTTEDQDSSNVAVWVFDLTNPKKTGRVFMWEGSEAFSRTNKSMYKSTRSYQSKCGDSSNGHRRYLKAISEDILELQGLLQFRTVARSYHENLPQAFSVMSNLMGPEVADRHHYFQGMRTATNGIEPREANRGSKFTITWLEQLAETLVTGNFQQESQKCVLPLCMFPQLLDSIARGTKTWSKTDVTEWCKSHPHLIAAAISNFDPHLRWDPDNLSTDHIIPLMYGGEDHRDNYCIVPRGLNGGWSDRLDERKIADVGLNIVKRAVQRFMVNPPSTLEDKDKAAFLDLCSTILRIDEKTTQEVVIINIDTASSKSDQDSNTVVPEGVVTKTSSKRSRSDDTEESSTHTDRTQQLITKFFAKKLKM